MNVLKDNLPYGNGHVLEFASGSGMHIIFFAPYFKELQFHPSDKSDEAFENIQILIAEQNNANVTPPIKLDLTLAETWPETEKHLFDAILCINIFQVAATSIADGMMSCTSRLPATTFACSNLVSRLG